VAGVNSSYPSVAGIRAGATDRGAVGSWAVTLGLLMVSALLPLRLLGVDAWGSSPVATAATLLVAYSPSLAALAVAAWWPGGRGARRLLGQALRWRVNPGWYVLALAGPILLVLAVARIQVARGTATRS
jgi:hypothetical protein